MENKAAHARNYETEWGDYRRRRWYFWTIFLTYVPGVIAIGYVAELLGAKDERVMIRASIVWMIAFGIVGFWSSLWHCPRCRERFFWGPRYINPWARACLNCKLPF